MRFAVVSESREWSEPTSVAMPARIAAEDVEQEARRRKSLLHLEEWQLREYVTDRPVPDRIMQLCREIDLAASALTRLASIPADFADDLYWPRVW